MIIGFLWGCLFYFMALIISLMLYRVYSPWYKNILPIIFLSCLGHFIGTLAYSYISSDSLLIFFRGATPYFLGFSTEFVQNMVWYVRDFITGDSYLGTLYFFSAFAFIGSVLWYLLFLQCAKQIGIDNQNDSFPALVIMCWPSFLFFTAGIGKDSLTYFLLPIIFMTWHHLYYETRYKCWHFINLIVCVMVITMLRPYLLLILLLAYLFSVLKKENIKTSILWVLVLSPLLWYVIVKALAVVGLNDFNLINIGSRVLLQQQMQNSGTSFPIFFNHPILVLLLLPYSFVMNLFFPLFLFAKNGMGLLASIENCFLILLTVFFLKKRSVYKYLKTQLPTLRLLFSFFITGMLFMSLINTNLGLSTRQKSMYLPLFLVLTMLVWLKNKNSKRVK